MKKITKDKLCNFRVNKEKYEAVFKYCDENDISLPCELRKCISRLYDDAIKKVLNG